MPEYSYDKSNPTYYDQFFGYNQENLPCESRLQDDLYGEYISIYGQPIDIYICSEYNPTPVFGEDPVKKYELPSFVAKGIWEPTPEVLNLGQYGKNTNDELIIIYMHKSTIRESIRKTLLDAGIITEEETFPSEDGSNVYERHRRELQEGDMLRLHFNNIHYEIDGIKEEPEYQHLWYKYIYEIHARPRLITNESLGDMQDVTDSEKVRQDHNNELDIESNKILF